VRTSFELKFEAENYNSAVNLAAKHIGEFLDIPIYEVPDKTDTELKVEIVDGKYQVTAYSKIKTNFITFGLDKQK
jgi:hypothetical protein